MKQMNVLGMGSKFQKTGLSGPFRIDDLYKVIFGRSGAYTEKLFAHDGKGFFLMGVTPSLNNIKAKTLTSVPVVIWSSYAGEYMYLTAWSRSTMLARDTLLEENQILILTEHITEPVLERGQYAVLRFKLNAEFPYLYIITGKPSPTNEGLNITLNMEPFMKFAPRHD